MALINRPEIPIDLRYVWDAFGLLTYSRQIGFATGPIALSEIAAYVSMFGTPDVSFFVACILALDCEYLALLREDSERKNGK